MDNPEIKIYGTDWCGDCRRSKRFMDEYDVSYQWIDVEEDAEATIVFEDGSILVEPSNSELARKLGISA
jgi:glutaredoxin